MTNRDINVILIIDYKKGIKAYNTAGMDVSSSVTTTIKNSSGTIVSESKAFSTPGKYTITYTLKDFTGVTKTATASITVRDNPKFTFGNSTLTFDRESTTYTKWLSSNNRSVIFILGRPSGRLCC